MPDTCFSPFFPRILIHFINFNFGVSHWFWQGLLPKPTLQLVTQVQQVAVRQSQFARKLIGAGALADASQDKDPLAWRLMRFVQQCLRIAVKDAATATATVIQNRGAIPPVSPIVFLAAAWATQTVRVKKLQQELVTNLLIHEIRQRKIKHDGLLRETAKILGSKRTADKQAQQGFTDLGR
jgi:hypothetical protein